MRSGPPACRTSPPPSEAAPRGGREAGDPAAPGDAAGLCSPPPHGCASASRPGSRDGAATEAGAGRRARRFGGALVASRARRVACALLAGAILSLTLPPFDVLPAVAAWSALLALVMAGEARARRRLVERLTLGFAFGFGYHLAGLWWVGGAFLVDARTFGALLPLGVAGLPLLLAPFHALAVALAGLAPATMAWRALALALAVGGSEWLRGVALTGFPWNTAGIALTAPDGLAQGAAAVGLAGLAPLAVLTGALPAVLATRGSRWLAVLAVALLLAATGWGIHRLAAVPTPHADAPTVRVVQPSVPQSEKWDPARREAIWARLLALTAGGGDARIVVWPETAIPFLYDAPSIEALELAEALAGRTLVTGAVVVEPTAEGRRATNSVLVIGPDGAVRQRYDKVHLVPFGEYLPLPGLLSRIGLRALVEGASDFAPGARRGTLDLPGLPPALPLVCYEIIFPHETAETPAGVIVNVTNDAWFGDTPGPRQHLRHARMRAIESGRTVLRAANNGISAVLDPAGRTLLALPLNARGAFEAPVPPPVPTPYARLGDGPLLVLLALALAAAILHRKTRSRGRVSGV